MEINDHPASEAKVTTMELLKYLEVSARAHHLPSKLSGGATGNELPLPCLANRPDLILADAKPTAALDSVRGRQVMELFRKVAHEQNAA